MVSSTTSPAALGGAISRRELFLWLAALLLANQILRVQGENPQQYLTDIGWVLAGKSVFYFLAWYAVFTLLASSNTSRAVERGEFVFALAIFLFNFLPAYSVVWLSATAVAVYLWLRSENDKALAAAAAVLLAIVLNGFWGPHVFDLVAPYLLRADAALVSLVLSVVGDGEVYREESVVGIAGRRGIIVYAPCSSFHNISLGLLCWVAVTKLVRVNWVRGDAAIAALIVATVIILNVGRLTIIASRPEDYEYWHVGSGAEMFVWLTTAAVLAISLWGALRTQQPR